MENLKDQYCCGCLSQKEVLLQNYTVQNEVMKAVFQRDTIVLCYICKRVAQHTEQFILNVQTNQIYLKNIAHLSKTSIIEAQSQTPVIIKLTLVNQEPIELGKEENVASEDNEKPETEKCEAIDEKKEILIKDEVKEELLQYECIDDDFVDDNDFQNAIVKNEEDQCYLKQEVDLDNLDLKHLSKVLKNGKLKKNHRGKKKSTKSLKSVILEIEKIYITKKQCLEEMERMANENSYKNSIFKCTDCVKGFNYKESFENHLLKHSAKMGDFVCEICKQRTDSEEKLKSHKKYHEIRYKCPSCGITRNNRLSIKDHYAVEHSDQFSQYTCIICAKAFRRKVGLQKHLVLVHSNRERVACRYCPKTYASKQVLKSHMISQHPKEVSAVELSRRFACDECGKGFKAPSQLKNHSIKHSISKDYYCVECDKSFKSDAILKHHLKTASPHVKYIELPLACLHCEKRFSIKRDLVRHTNRVHLNIKPFQCDKCDKAYVNGSSLTEHKRITHEGYKRPLKFPCTMCDKVFDRNQILKSHIRTHTGERPYQCAECGAQFSQRSILRTHHKLIHLNLTRDGRPKHTLR